MSNIIFDIGLMKTGTTSRQRFFSELKDIIYIDYFDIKTRIPITDKTVVVSYEFLSGDSCNPNSTLEERLEIAWKLSKCYPNAKIIICLRNKEGWLKSAYNQWCWSSYAYTWNEYKEKYPISLLYWDKYINYLETLFGRWNVYIASFEEMKKDSYKFYKGLCNFIGCEMPNKFKSYNLNHSPSKKIINFLIFADKIKFKFIRNLLRTLLKYVSDK